MCFAKLDLETWNSWTGREAEPLITTLTACNCILIYHLSPRSGDRLLGYSKPHLENHRTNEESRITFARLIHVSVSNCCNLSPRSGDRLYWDIPNLILKTTEIIEKVNDTDSCMFLSRIVVNCHHDLNSVHCQFVQGVVSNSNILKRENLDYKSQKQTVGNGKSIQIFPEFYKANIFLSRSGPRRALTKTKICHWK